MNRPLVTVYRHFFFFASFYLLNSAAATVVVSYLLTVTGGLPSQQNTLELSCTMHKLSNTRPTETTARSKNHFALFLFVFAGNDSIFPTKCYLGVFLLHNGFLSQIRFSKLITKYQWCRNTNTFH